MKAPCTKILLDPPLRKGEVYAKLRPLKKKTQLDKDAMRRIAANVTNATRAFNVREGLKPQDDRLPPRFYREAIGEGRVVTEEEMDILLREYYKVRGWDEQGIPSKGEPSP